MLLGIVIILFVACDDGAVSSDKTDSVRPKRVHPPEALKLSDSAFQIHFTKNDSASLETALKLYYQSLKLDPENFITLNNIWQLENRLSLNNAALETSRKMLRTSNNDITCIGMVGLALDRVGDSAQARKYYRWSLEVTDKILDTMAIGNAGWMTVQINKVSMHTMLGEQNAADAATDILLANADPNSAAALEKFKGKTRADYLKVPDKVE